MKTELKSRFISF